MPIWFADMLTKLMLQRLLCHLLQFDRSYWRNNTFVSLFLCNFRILKILSIPCAVLSAFYRKASFAHFFSESCLLLAMHPCTPLPLVHNCTIAHEATVQSENQIANLVLTSFCPTAHAIIAKSTFRPILHMENSCVFSCV